MNLYRPDSTEQKVMKNWLFSLGEATTLGKEKKSALKPAMLS